MKIAVVNVPATSKGIQDYARTLAIGMGSMGHEVDILDAWTEDSHKLTAYDYVAVCAEPVFIFGGKIPEVLAGFLAGGNGVLGKKSAAFIVKTTPFHIDKALANLMQIMEKEGMMINWNEVIRSVPQAEKLGKQIGP